MKRSWKSLQNLKDKSPDFLVELCRNYETSVCFTGKGWISASLAGFGQIRSTQDYSGSFLEQLAQLQTSFQDYIFGHAAYDLKSETEPVDSRHMNEDGFRDLYFFVPEIVIEQRDSECRVGYFSEDSLAEFESRLSVQRPDSGITDCDLAARTDQKNYSGHCNALLNHIQRGDIYEINYCIDFIGKSELLDPVHAFRQLNRLADAPMSVLYRNQDAWLMCASPERYISRSGNRLISQPIKGTIRRGKNPEEDQQLRNTLQNDPKERSENVMIVDLVRNDLSRVAKKGSVKVSELFGIHTFKTVHQMISTVECEVDAATSFAEILKATFPMGSMTGAPKISAMKLAEVHETQSRGIYSGCVGCILPNGDFDFNVVIRSITWNAATGHVSAKAGGAITAGSIPEKEYEECLLKAAAMMNALKG